VAAAALVRLQALSGREDFRRIAQRTLEAFAGVIEHYGLYAGSYGLALEQWLLPPIQAAILGTGEGARKLATIANARFAVNKAVLALSAAQVRAGDLPPALRETLPHLPAVANLGSPGGPTAVAVVCRGTSCLPPATTIEALIEQINASV
jgi:hypothetical protein